MLRFGLLPLQPSPSLHRQQAMLTAGFVSRKDGRREVKETVVRCAGHPQAQRRWAAIRSLRTAAEEQKQTVSLGPAGELGRPWLCAMVRSAREHGSVAGPGRRTVEKGAMTRRSLRTAIYDALRRGALSARPMQHVDRQLAQRRHPRRSFYHKPTHVGCMSIQVKRWLWMFHAPLPIARTTQPST